jgi:hypothetical protein
MESKLYKLEIKFSEIKIDREVDTAALNLFLSCGSITSCVKFHSNSTLSLPNYSSDSVLELKLEEKEIVIGTGTIILGNICDKTLTGDFKKWLKLEVKNDSKLKIKIQGSLRNPRRSSPSKPRPSYLFTSSSKIKSKCPYIKKLSVAEDREKDIQTVIQKIKTRMDQNYGDLIEDGIKSPVHTGRSPGRSPLRRRNTEKFGEAYELELPSRFDINIEKLSSNEPNLLRYATIALCERIKVMRTQAEEYQSIFTVISTFQDPMKDLKNSLVETKEQLLRENHKTEELKERILKETGEIDKEFQVSLEKALLTEVDIQNITKEYEDIRVKNEALAVPGTYENISKEIETLTKEFHDIDHQREVLLHQTEVILTEYDDHQLDIERSKVLDEKFQYIAQLQSKNSILDHIVIENLQLNGEIALLSAQLLAEEDAKTRMSEIESHKETFSIASESLEEDLKNLSSQKDKSIQEASDFTKKLEIDIKDLETSSETLNNELETKETKISTQTEVFKKLNDANQEAKMWIQKDEEEFAASHENFLEKYEADKNAKDVLVKELAFFSDLTLMHVSSSLIEERIHRRLDEMLEEKDHQKHSMKTIIRKNTLTNTNK